jgi:hypothetical protein
VGRYLNVALAASLLACATAPASAPGLSSEKAADLRPRHAAIVHAALPEARRAVFDRFTARNGATWALVAGLDDVDPFRLFLRRAIDESPCGANVPSSAEEAERDAIAFLQANADVLGMTPADVVLLEAVRRAMTFERPTPRTAWEIRLQATVPMKGYESFETLASKLDVTVFVDEDRKVRYFENASVIHPRLAIDTRAGLTPDDPRLLKSVLGRQMYVAVPDSRGGGVTELRHQAVGRVREEDVVERQLVIHPSPAPLGAWMTYRLAYLIRVGLGGEWFRFIVDADTGELVEDAAAPIKREDPGSLL